MLYTGIDYHKKYSVVSTQDATGARVCEARIEDNEPAAFAAYFAIDRLRKIFDPVGAGSFLSLSIRHSHFEPVVYHGIQAEHVRS